MKIVNDANNQYLGHCMSCHKFDSLSNIEGLCYSCRKELRDQDTIKNGYDKKGTLRNITRGLVGRK